jgi:hypothetical protein
MYAEIMASDTNEQSVEGNPSMGAFEQMAEAIRG